MTDLTKEILDLIEARLSETIRHGNDTIGKEAEHGVVESEHGDSGMAVSAPGRAGSREGAGLAVRGVAGTATYYGLDFAGLPMANGQPYNPWNPHTTASNRYALGTVLEVEYRRVITVEVTDRGAFSHELDLSLGAFKALVGSTEPGVIEVQIRVIP